MPDHGLEPTPGELADTAYHLIHRHRPGHPAAGGHHDHEARPEAGAAALRWLSERLARALLPGQVNRAAARQLLASIAWEAALADLQLDAEAAELLPELDAAPGVVPITGELLADHAAARGEPDA